MQPLDTCLPMVVGSLVPWMRYSLPPRYIARAPSGLPGAAGDHARQLRLARDHLLRRIPVRPLGLARDMLHARPGEALATDADAVADRLAVAEHVIEGGVRGIDDDGAGRLGAGVGDGLPLQARIELRVCVLLGGRILRGDLVLRG